MVYILIRYIYVHAKFNYQRFIIPGTYGHLQELQIHLLTSVVGITATVLIELTNKVSYSSFFRILHNIRLCDKIYYGCHIADSELSDTSSVGRAQTAKLARNHNSNRFSHKAIYLIRSITLYMHILYIMPIITTYKLNYLCIRVFSGALVDCVFRPKYNFISQKTGGRLI